MPIPNDFDAQFFYIARNLDDLEAAMGNDDLMDCTIANESLHMIKRTLLSRMVS
ncbi:MAG: hypothetical protein ACI84R_000936 [Candidatus Azotimanducaceae bacterium]|jgi:hypothetical protein